MIGEQSIKKELGIGHLTPLAPHTNAASDTDKFAVAHSPM
jgi:hypothetical protein